MTNNRAAIFIFFSNFCYLLFSNKATKIDKIFTVELTVTTYCQIDSEDFVIFCGLLRKHELYKVLFGTLYKSAEMNAAEN